MFPVLGLLKRLKLRTTWLPVGSAIFWALLHAAKFPSQGLMVAWPFYIFSAAIIRWDPVSRNFAYLSTALIHSLFNLGIVSCEILFWFRLDG